MLKILVSFYVMAFALVDAFSRNREAAEALSRQGRALAIVGNLSYAVIMCAILFAIFHWGMDLTVGVSTCVALLDFVVGVAVWGLTGFQTIPKDRSLSRHDSASHDAHDTGVTSVEKLAAASQIAATADEAPPLKEYWMLVASLGAFAAGLIELVESLENLNNIILHQ